MVISLLANVAKEKVENNKFLGDIPHANVYNQGLSTSNLDLDSCRYAPQAVIAGITGENFHKIANGEV